MLLRGLVSCLFKDKNKRRLMASSQDLSVSTFWIEASSRVHDVSVIRRCFGHHYSLPSFRDIALRVAVQHMRLQCTNVVIARASTQSEKNVVMEKKI